MRLSLRRFQSLFDLEPAAFEGLLRHADAIRRGEVVPDLRGRVAALLFFDPSLRTRVSLESALARFGGSASTLHPGRDSWVLESETGAVMDGDAQEHVRELAPVLSRMCHVIGIRRAERIGGGQASGEAVVEDAFFETFAEHAQVPVINMESNRWHPLQGLADAATIRQLLPDPRGKRFVLTWSWHPRALPVATPHSQLVAAASLGMEVTLLRPEGYDLVPEVVAAARERAEAAGGSLSVTSEREASFDGAHVVCAKSWGALRPLGGSVSRVGHAHGPESGLRRTWIVDREAMARTADAWFLHCLPVRRNVVVTDDVLDGPRSAVVAQAENRLWTAAALLDALLGADAVG